jgi:putative transposase
MEIVRPPSPTPGARYSLNGELFEITRIDNGFIRFRGVHLQRERVLALADFYKQLKTGLLALKINAPIEISNAPLIAAMQANVRTKYERRLAYVQGFYREFRGSLPRTHFRRKVDEIARSLNETTTPSYTQLYRWNRIFMTAGGNPLALVPSTAGPVRRRRRINQTVLERMEGYIRDEYLKKERPSAQQIYDLFRTELLENNLSRSEADQITIPSRQAFFRAIWALDPYVVDMMRFGHLTARKTHRYGRSIRAATRIGERVEADCHLLDVLVVDSEHKIIGRPWLCALMDIYSRCVVGWEISFTPPCASKVLRALRHAMSDASSRIYGCAPEELVVDNGPEFQNSVLQTVAGTYGISLRYVEPRSPNQKPHIERFFGTVAVQLTHMMPGTTRSSPTDRGEYDAEAHATLNLDEVRGRFQFWLDNVYHLSPHETLSVPPSEMWRIGTQTLPPTRYPDADLTIACRSFVMRTISCGRVGFSRLRWSGPSLPDVAARLHHKKQDQACVFYDETDLGTVWVQDPDDRSIFYQADATDPEYQCGLSLFEHQLLQQAVRKDKVNFVTADLLRAKSTLYRQLASDTKRARKQLARTTERASKGGDEDLRLATSVGSPECAQEDSLRSENVGTLSLIVDPVNSIAPTALESPKAPTSNTRHASKRTRNRSDQSRNPQSSHDPTTLPLAKGSTARTETAPTDDLCGWVLE